MYWKLGPSDRNLPVVQLLFHHVDDMWIRLRGWFASVCVEHSQRLHVSKDTFYRSLKAMSRFGLLFYVLIPCPIVSFQCLLCSSLCLFPFLLVACLSPSVCLSARLLCAFPSLCNLSSPLPSHLTCSPSGHLCVCVYSICLPMHSLSVCFVWCPPRVPCVSSCVACLLVVCFGFLTSYVCLLIWTLLLVVLCLNLSCFFALVLLTSFLCLAPFVFVLVPFFFFSHFCFFK